MFLYVFCCFKKDVFSFAVSIFVLNLSTKVSLTLVALSSVKAAVLGVLALFTPFSAFRSFIYPLESKPSDFELVISLVSACFFIFLSFLMIAST